MRVSKLHAFRGRGVVSKVALVSINEPTAKGMTQTEAVNITDVLQLERMLTEAGFGPSATWRLTLFEIACDFTMPRHDDIVFNIIYRRINSGLTNAKAAEGITRRLE